MKHPEIVSKSFGIGLYRFAGTAPGIFGLVSFGLGVDLAPKSTIYGRILCVFGALLAQPSEIILEPLEGDF